MASNAIAAPVNSTSVIGLEKISTSQRKLSAGCSNNAMPASVVVTCGRLLAMNIQPMQCEKMP